jgi:urease accessory protein
VTTAHTAERRSTRLRVDPAADGVRVAELTSGSLLSPRVLESRGRRVRIALVGHTASLLAGDRLELEVEVGPGVHLELVEPSGTVAYDARGGHASWAAQIHIGANASLVWRAAPFVVAGGSDVDREVDVQLEAGGVAVVREMLALGRHGEIGGSLISRQRVTLAGAPLLVEALDLRDAESRALPGLLGGHRVLATAMILGLATDTEVDTWTTPLAGPGALSRALTDAAHEAEEALARPWTTWLAALARHTGAHHTVAGDLDHARIGMTAAEPVR